MPMTDAMRSRVTLEGLERSVYTRIVRIVLEEKNVTYTLDAVDPFAAGGGAEARRAGHPFGRIPVLRHGDFVVYEASAITRYVDEAFEGRSLRPVDVRARARMNQVIGSFDAYAYRPMVWGVFVPCVLREGDLDAERVAESLAASATCLETLEEPLGRDRYLAGSSPSLADFHAFPMIRYLALADEGRRLLDRTRNVRRWFGEMLRRDSVQDTRSRYEMAGETT
jgi:glutathione S-transferase